MAARAFFLVAVFSVVLPMCVVPCGALPLVNMAHSFTKDMTLMCNLTSFLDEHRNDYSNIIDIKIVHRTGPDEDNVTKLAALDMTRQGKSIASVFLLNSNRVFDISNYFYHSSEVEKTNYTLLFTNVDLYDYGDYFCRIHFQMKNPVKPDVFNSTLMSFLPSTTEIQEQGSSLKVETGLALTCAFTSSIDLNTSNYTIRIAAVGSEEQLVAWHGGTLTNGCTRNTAYSTRAVVCRAITLQNAQGVTNTVILRVHLQKVNCTDQRTYRCFVDRPRTTTMYASTVVDHVSGQSCPSPSSPDPPCNSTLPTGAAVGRKADRVVLTVVGLLIVVLQVLKTV